MQTHQNASLLNSLAAVSVAALMAMTSPLTAEEQPALPLGDQIRVYLLEHPEVIVEAMDVLRARQQAEESRADVDLVTSFSAELFDDGFSPVAGNPDGDVTIVEFVDYRCGYCKKAHDEVMAVVSGDPNIRYIVKELPVLGPESETAAKVALAVHQIAPEAFETVNDELMRLDGPITPAAITKIVAKRGLNAEEIMTVANGEAIADRLSTVRRLAERLGVNGTPGFVIGNRIIRGYVPYEGMIKIIAEERAKS